MKARRVSSGIPPLDGIIGGLKVGDNVVWHVESGSFMEVFASGFLKASRKTGHPMVLVSFNTSPKTLMGALGAVVNHPDVILVDAFTWGKGEGADLFTGYYDSRYTKCQCRIVGIRDPQNLREFIRQINDIEEGMPKGARYLFDSLTGMGQLWGEEEKVLTFFTRQCPRLFELETIAYWVLEKSAHSESFRAQINHITQVAIDLGVKDGLPTLSVLKAEGRDRSNILRPRAFQVRKSRVELIEEHRKAKEISIGPRIRALRHAKGMSQVELARAVGVTSSTISQVESGQILLSVPALIKAARALGVSLDSLVTDSAKSESSPVRTREQRQLVRLKPFGENQVVAYSLGGTAPAGRIEAFEIHIQPGAQLRGHFFLNKSEELGILMEGELKVQFAGDDSWMKPGDTIHLLNQIPERWTNTKDAPARLLWVLGKGDQSHGS